ncbi:unnamed protein product [Ilex paraguariensis]|uniref:Uncharacterized protein n=1 Tax=Ilex paraguariensis TaxID=185542 RepID=A0ABC8T2J2_9AQUA
MIVLQNKITNIELSVTSQKFVPMKLASYLLMLMLIHAIKPSFAVARLQAVSTLGLFTVPSNYVSYSLKAVQDRESRKKLTPHPPLANIPTHFKSPPPRPPSPPPPISMSPPLPPLSPPPPPSPSA